MIYDSNENDQVVTTPYSENSDVATNLDNAPKEQRYNFIFICFYPAFKYQ